MNRKQTLIAAAIVDAACWLALGLFITYSVGAN